MSLTMHYAQYTMHYAPYTMHEDGSRWAWQYTMHYTLCTIHYSLCTRTALDESDNALCTIHFTLCTRTTLDGPGNHGKRRLQCVGRELLPDPPESNIGQLLSRALWVKCRAGAEGKGSKRFIAGPSTYRAKFTELTSNRNSKCRGSL